MINKQIATYLNSKYKDKDDQISEQLDTRYFILPYIGSYSSFTQRKIRKLITKCCKPIDIKVVFTSFKLSSMISAKDMIPKRFINLVFINLHVMPVRLRILIGETTRHVSTRISEHLSHDKNSHIYKHIMASTKCKALANVDSFVILDHASTQWQLKIKEGLHIHWESPTLNKQLRHVTFKMALYVSIETSFLYYSLFT